MIIRADNDGFEQRECTHCNHGSKTLPIKQKFAINDIINLV